MASLWRGAFWYYTLDVCTTSFAASLASILLPFASTAFRIASRRFNGRFFTTLAMFCNTRCLLSYHPSLGFGSGGKIIVVAVFGHGQGPADDRTKLQARSTLPCTVLIRFERLNRLLSQSWTIHTCAGRVSLPFDYIEFCISGDVPIVAKVYLEMKSETRNSSMT